MEFGVVGFDGLSSSLMGSNNEFNSADFEKQKYYGSGFLKHERSGVINHDDWRALKSAKKSDDFSSTELRLQNKCGPLKSSSSNSSVFGSDSQNMLSFASPKVDTFLGRSNGTGFMENNSNSRSLENAAASALPYFQNLSAAAYSKNAGLLGYCSGGLNGMYYMDGVKGGLFTPSQWLELEHQALIFKYITANEPIPPNLLLPIRKALESAGFSAFSAGHFRPSATWGWNPFHLAFSSNSDPEPGRCRRTDGKKWRCSRDAMPDQKYCERHMNRGRHRSRKPVEGQTNNGHPPPPTSTGSATTTTTAASNTNNNKMNNHQHLFSTTTSSSNSSHVVVAPGASNSFNVVNQQSSNLGSANASPSTSPFINRLLVNKQDSPSLGMQNDSAGVSSTYLVSPSTNVNNLNSGENSSLVLNSQFSFNEQQNSDHQFGIPSSDLFLNKCSSFNSNNYDVSYPHDLNHQKPKSDQTPQHSLCSFKGQSSSLWPELDPDPSDRDRTQLSISVPMAPSDYMSSTSSPINDKTSSSLSPLRLSREQHPDSIQMGLGVGLSEPSKSQNQKTAANWIPITSMGGPLGEVLNNSSFSGEYCNNSSALNLLSKDHCYSSPTGVLHKAALRSLSNSSAGSSPRAENSKSTGVDGGSLCTDLLGSSSATIVQHNSSLSTLQHS